MSFEVKIGSKLIGGNNPIAVQTMADEKTASVSKVLDEINSVANLGCDIFRVSVKDEADAKALYEIKKHSKLPIVADIHFDYKLALMSIDAGVDKVRINPGNIGSENNVREVALAIRQNNTAVRVGANSGSIKKEYLQKYGRSAAALGESALENVAILEKFGIDKIVISVKASSVLLNVEANRYLNQKTQYPLHIGVTEAGVGDSALIKSSIGIGSLLLDNIGSTIRVSLTDSIENEVIAAKKILRSIGLDKNFVEVISCPTCGRTEYDLKGLANAVAKKTENIKKHLKVAVMGCVVNGPGEAADCDIGIAGGKDKCVIFKGGEVYRTIDSTLAESEFLKEIDLLIKDGV